MADRKLWLKPRWWRAASPDLDDELVAYMLELDRNEPQLFAGLVGKHMSMQTPEQNRSQALKVPSIEELLAEFQRLGVPPPDRLLALLATKQAAAKESAQKKATQ